MAKQSINIGSSANDGQGDALRTAFDKVNDNFTDLYEGGTNNVNVVTIGKDTAVGGAITLTGSAVSQSGNTFTINTSAGQGNSGAIQYNNGGAVAGANDVIYASGILKVTSTIEARGDGTNAGKLKLYCENTTTPHAVTLEGPAHSGATAYTLKLPSPAPSNQQILQSDGSGVLSWINTPSSTAPQGDDGQYQYKNGSSFAGTDTLRFDADKIHIGKGGGAPTRGQLVMYGDGTNASDIQLYNSGNNKFLKLAQQAGATADLTLTFPGVAPGGDTKILQSDSSGQLSWIDTPSGGSGISFSGTTANGIATYSNSTTANVSSVFTVSGDKLSAPAGSLADPSIEVGAIGGLYAASGGILLAHNGANAIGVTSSSIVNYKLTQFQAGLKFGATGETLNSYEEGTWTPTSANANTISNASGKYTKVGNTVFASFAFTMTGSTSVALSGLPFSGVYSSTDNKGTSIISVNNCASVQGQLVGGQMATATSFIFNAYTGSGAGLPTKLQTTTSTLYQTSGGTYAGIIIYQTS